MDIKNQVDDLSTKIKNDAEKSESRLFSKLEGIQNKISDLDRIHSKLNDIGINIFDALKLQNDAS